MKKTILTLLLIAAATLAAQGQSLLTETPETPAQRTARQVLLAPQQTADVILGQLNDGTERLFGGENPQAVLDALGTRAGAVFALNTAFAKMVAQLLTSEGDTVRLARLQAILARIPAHTIHQDGTVTIDPVPEPTPESTPEP